MQTISALQSKLVPLVAANASLRTPRYLFRGQSQIYPSISSTFGRVPTTDLEVGQAYTVYRNAKRICEGLRGYKIGHEDGIAVLQHYGWPTPFIDLTGTLEIAIAFALMHATIHQEAVIYVVDATRIPDTSIVVEHDFLTHTLENGGLRHRWLRQDGYAIAPKEWRAASDSRDFDLLKEEFQNSLSEHRFAITPSDRSSTKGILSTETDPIPQQLQNLLRLFCQHQFGGNLAPQLQKLIDKMWPSSGDA